MSPRSIQMKVSTVAAILYGVIALSASSALAMDPALDRPFDGNSSGQGSKADLLNQARYASSRTSWRHTFGMMTVRTNRISGFERWQDMLSRSSLGCVKACPAHWQDWTQTTRNLLGISPFAQLKIINWFVNQTLAYRRDVVAFGVADYWASPVEALRRGGDCEDFVALKYLALRQAGFPEKNLRIVVLQDTKSSQSHAVLVAQLKGTNYVLDNQLDDLIADTELHHYRPLYSFNGLGKWVHLEVRSRQQVAMAD